VPAGNAKGFGFAGFMCRAHAEKAIKLGNGKVHSLSGLANVLWSSLAVTRAWYQHVKIKPVCTRVT